LAELRHAPSLALIPLS